MGYACDMDNKEISRRLTQALSPDTIMLVVFLVLNKYYNESTRDVQAAGKQDLVIRSPSPKGRNY